MATKEELTDFVKWVRNKSNTMYVSLLDLGVHIDAYLVKVEQEKDTPKTRIGRHSWISHEGRSPKNVGQCVKCGCIRRMIKGNMEYNKEGTFTNTSPDCL